VRGRPGQRQPPAVANECVAFSFEGSGAGIRLSCSRLRGPAAEPGLFALALRVKEAADGNDALCSRPALAVERPCRESRFGLDELDVGYFADGFVETLPLPLRRGSRGSVNVAGHPRVMT